MSFIYETLFERIIIFHLTFFLFSSEVTMSDVEMISDYVSDDVQYIPVTISGSEDDLKVIVLNVKVQR